jgi:hypothetical protein
LTPILILLACSEESPEESALKDLLIPPYTELLEGEENFILKQKLEEEVCSGKRGECSRTKRFISLSSDGLMFEYFQSDSEDNIYCNPYYPCSAVGDYGGGKTKMNVWWIGEGNLVPLEALPEEKPLEIHGTITSSGGDIASIARHWTPKGYPYLVVRKYSGGASCCIQYEFYLKEGLSLNPYVIGYSRFDVLFFNPVPNDTFQTIHPGSASNKIVSTEDITLLLENHFKEQIQN